MDGMAAGAALERVSRIERERLELAAGVHRQELVEVSLGVAELLVAPRTVRFIPQASQAGPHLGDLIIGVE